MKEGWVCPKCGKVLAPWVPSCDCYKMTLHMQINHPTEISKTSWQHWGIGDTEPKESES